MPLHRLLALLLLTIANASAQEWIWHSQNSADGEVRYFRKTFTLTAAPAEATLSVACDNRAKVFVNGVEVGASEDWKAPLKARVEKQLKAGENTIAIRGKNDDGVAALVARLEIKGGPAIASDTTWLSSDKEVPGWEKPGFTAAGWAKPIARGKLGGEPWGDVFSGKAAGGKGKAPATELATPAGFKAELLLAAQGKGEPLQSTGRGVAGNPGIGDPGVDPPRAQGGFQLGGIAFAPPQAVAGEQAVTQRDNAHFAAHDRHFRQRRSTCLGRRLGGRGLPLAAAGQQK